MLVFDLKKTTKGEMNHTQTKMEEDHRSWGDDHHSWGRGREEDPDDLACEEECRSGPE